MIRELLHMLAVEKLTLGQISERSGIPHDHLQGRLDMLVNLGYLEEAEDGGGCAGCSQAGTCTERRKDGRGPRYLELTSKGREALEK